MSIQYTVPGFEPTTFGTWVSSHNHLTRAPTLLLKCLQSIIKLIFCKVHWDNNSTESNWNALSFWFLTSQFESSRRPSGHWRSIFGASLSMLLQQRWGPATYVVLTLFQVFLPTQSFASSWWNVQCTVT